MACKGEKLKRGEEEGRKRGVEGREGERREGEGERREGGRREGEGREKGEGRRKEYLLVPKR
jgi:hypothetical protein